MAAILSRQNELSLCFYDELLPQFCLLSNGHHLADNIFDNIYLNKK